MKSYKTPQNIAVIGIALLLPFLSASCLKPVDFSVETIPWDETELPPEVPVVDNPDLGTMSRATADQIFDLEAYGTGLKIVKFKNVQLLLSYLLKSSSSWTGILPDTFKILTIDNMPVVSIADGAFASTESDGKDDITRAIKVLELPTTIQSLGRNLFTNVKELIFLDIPATALMFDGKGPTVIDEIVKNAAGNFAVVRIYPAATEEPPQIVFPGNLALFTRPSSGTDMYIIGFYDKSSGLASLSKNGIDYTQYKVTDPHLQKLFNAIYEPNKPGSTDAVESEKFAIPYNSSISAAALDLFKITIGVNPSDDKVELKGTDLPIAAGASASNLIVIDIGIPGEDNSGLAFSIPYQGLGVGGNYAHVRFRVNKGAYLAILADNTRYESRGAGNSCPSGNFNGGCVEVMADGKLRDSAWEGFPLGANAVILCRYNSYLAVGPESYGDTSPLLNYTGSAFPKYYAGWLIGSALSSDNKFGGSSLIPRIVWDGGQTSEKYIEVREGELAIDAEVTVRRSFGLIYSVWFVNNAALTIDILASEPIIFSTPPPPPTTPVHGVFANGLDYIFYGTAKTKITIFSGSVLDPQFLNTTVTVPIGPGSSPTLIIQGSDEGHPKSYVDSSTGISGIHIPYPSP
jgi:hypothetical protein